MADSVNGQTAPSKMRSGLWKRMLLRVFLCSGVLYIQSAMQSIPVESFLSGGWLTGWYSALLLLFVVSIGVDILLHYRRDALSEKWKENLFMIELGGWALLGLIMMTPKYGCLGTPAW